MDFSKYIFRCHYQGSLISVPKPLTEKQKETLEAYRIRANGEGRPLTDNQKKVWHSLEHKENESKKFKITDTAKNVCNEIVFFEKTRRKYKLENKYFSKGLSVEKDSRDLVSEVLGSMLICDDERKSNKWVTGKRDIKHDSIIIDIKSTYDFTSFNKHLIDSKNEYYFRQLDSYMDLWGIKDSLLAYALVDTPFNLIDDEIRKLNYKKDILNIDGDVREEKINHVVKLIEDHIFTRKSLEEYCQQSSIVKIEWFNDFMEIPKSERLHLVPHSYDKERILQRNECLSLCREYMNTVKPMNNINYKI